MITLPALFLLTRAALIQPQRGTLVFTKVRPTLRTFFRSQALGAKPEVEVALTAVVLERHDYLLLCSEGLSNKITALEMQQIVQEADSPASACQVLTKLANMRGGEDNISVIVAQFAGEGLYEASQDAPASQLAKAA